MMMMIMMMMMMMTGHGTPPDLPNLQHDVSQPTFGNRSNYDVDRNFSHPEYAKLIITQTLLNSYFCTDPVHLDIKKTWQSNALVLCLFLLALEENERFLDKCPANRVEGMTV